MNKIEVRHAYLNYKDNDVIYNALSDLNFSVDEGEFVSIIGSSGCGKSTILNVLTGLLPLTNGEIMIDGVPVNAPGKDRGVIFQHYSLFPWMTAKRNVSFGIKQIVEGKSRKEIDEISDKYLELVGLDEFKNKYPFQLSGGMQQRVAIARTLALDSEIIFLDEPFGAIDAKTRLTLQDLLLELLETRKKTVVFVTHDVEEAIFLSDRILFMSNKHIEEEIKVSFKRPRIRDEIYGTSLYNEIRQKIMRRFNIDVGNKIGGAEVYL